MEPSAFSTGDACVAPTSECLQKPYPCSGLHRYTSLPRTLTDEKLSNRGSWIAVSVSGTELVSTPKKLPGPMSNEWLDTYKLLGMPIYPDNKDWRYLAWVTFKAAPEADDLNKLKEETERRYAEYNGRAINFYKLFFGKS